MVDHIILQESKIKAFEIKLKHWFIFNKNGFKVNQFLLFYRQSLILGILFFDSYAFM